MIMVVAGENPSAPMYELFEGWETAGESVWVVDRGKVSSFFFLKRGDSERDGEGRKMEV